MTAHGATPATASVPRHGARPAPRRRAFARAHFARAYFTRGAFTMVEMLTVIGIIVILMAILLPVVAKVRTQARVAATQSEMTKIGDAIEQYFLEYKAYPGPVSNTGISKGLGPLPPSDQSPRQMTMTENLVVALCGGLQNNNFTISYVSTDLQSSIGPLNLNPNQFKQTRHIAFIDATAGKNMPPLPWDGANGRTGTSDTSIPEFQDRFDPPRPILYARAQRGNPVNAGAAPGSTNAYVVCGTDDNTTQYNYTHLTTAYSNGGTDFKMNGATPLDKNNNPIPNAAVYYTDWYHYLGNPNNLTTPRGVDKYILISAGPDGIFGTQDDIFYP